LDRRAEQTRHASQETIHIEEQARVRGLSAEKQKTASIQAELDERLQKYQEELNNQEISQDDFNRRSVAAEREASAEKAEANAEARKKMAGEFDSFFKGMKDSRKYLIEQGDKAAGNAAATLWQHFQQRGKSDQGDAGAGKKGGLFDDLLGSVGVKRHGHGADAKAEQPGGHETHAAEKMFSVSHATIQIGSASFAGGGFGGGSTAGGSTAGGNASLGAPGSTSLLAPGGSVASPEAGAPTGATGARLGASGAATGMDGMMEGGAPGISGGGAGDSGGAGSSISSRINSGIGIAKQGYGLVKQIGSSFGGAGSGSGSGDGGANSGDAGDVGAGISGGGAEDSGGAGLMAGGNGSFTTASGNQVVDASSLGPSGDGESSSSIAGTQSAAGGGGMAAAGGVVAGGLGVYSASQGSGGAGGAMKGAASGAEVGAAFGPIGMAVGAVVGGVIGYMGSGKEARKYDIKEVRPHIANTLSGFENGSMDYSSAYADMQSLQTEAFKVTDKMGHSGRTYRNEYITPEIHQAEGKLTSMERSGRSQYTTSGATYDVGSDYVPGTGWNLNHLGERIMPSDQNERITRAIESQGRMPVQSSSMGDVHLHVHAIDARGVSAFLDQYKHNILAATNDARGENSGGGYN
jgi:hypothetical protein